MLGEQKEQPKEEQKQVGEPREDDIGETKERHFQEEVRFKPISCRKSSVVTLGV